MKRTLLLAFAVVAVLFAAAIAFFPFWAVLIPLPEVEIDLRDRFPEKFSDSLANKSLKMKFVLARHERWDFELKGEGALLDWPAAADAKLSYGMFPPRVSAVAEFRIEGLPARIAVKGDCSLSGGWNLEAESDGIDISSADPVLESLAYSFLPETAVDLAFSGKAEFSASASAASIDAPPEWNACGRLSGFSIAYSDDGTDIRIAALGTPFGADGAGDIVRMHPMFVHAREAGFGGVLASNLFASVRGTETAYLVTEGGCDIFGGKARVYSTFLSREKLNVGTTLFLDGIEAGEVVSRIPCFNGEAGGKLFGKLPVKINGAGEVEFGEGYLYSVPGEKGRFRIFDSRGIADTLAAGGIPETDMRNVELALKDVEYSALSFELRKEEARSYALKIFMEGIANCNGVSVPLKLEPTIHGEINQLVNFGIRAATGKERKK